MLQQKMRQQKKPLGISANHFSRRNTLELQGRRRDVALLTQKGQSITRQRDAVDEAPDNKQED
jgi:hypothetical protein